MFSRSERSGSTTETPDSSRDRSNISEDLSVTREAILRILRQIPNGSIIRNLQLNWDGSVVIVFNTPEDQDSWFPEKLVIGALDQNQLTALEPLISKQQSKYPGEKIIDGAIIFSFQDGRINPEKLTGSVNRGNGVSFHSLDSEETEFKILEKKELTEKDNIDSATLVEEIMILLADLPLRLDKFSNPNIKTSDEINDKLGKNRRSLRHEIRRLFGL